MKFIEIEGENYLLWLVENILYAIGNPLPGKELVCLARPNTKLFESLISLRVVDVQIRHSKGYDLFIKGPNYEAWTAANTSLKV